MSKTTISIIIICLIILLPSFIFENQSIEKIKNPILKDGDVIMFKFETPVLYWANKKRNSSTYITKEIQNSISYWFHGNHYTHAGIAVNGKILHLTSDPMYDNHTKTYVVGQRPVLSTIEDIFRQPSLMYLYRINKKVSGDIKIPDVKIRNDIIDALVEHIANIIVDDKYYSCTRLVDDIQYQMGIRKKKNKFADLKTVIEGYNTPPLLIETPWSKYRGF